MFYFYLMHITFKTLEDIPVLRLKSESGVKTASETWKKLEALIDLKGRKAYGLYFPELDWYFACVSTNDKSGLEGAFSQFFSHGRIGKKDNYELYTIPGGKYASTKMTDWQKRINEIGKTFMKLSQEMQKQNHKVDNAKPCVEYYRSDSELICMLPVKE